MTLTRRALFKGMGASLLMAPSIVRASSLDYVPREVKEDLVIGYWEYDVTGNWCPHVMERRLVPKPWVPFELHEARPSVVEYFLRITRSS